MAKTDVTYSVDGVAFSAYGVYVSASDGVVYKPAIKLPLSDDRPWMHGICYDLSSIYYKECTIQLKCFIEAKGYSDYLNKALGFLSAFGNAPETHNLGVNAGRGSFGETVMLKDAVDIDKAWNASKFVGTFTLKLTVPHPAIPTVVNKSGGTVANGDVGYFVDGYNFNAYGVYVSASTGITTLPAIKEPLTYNWGNQDGVDYFSDGVRYKEREITLKCFIEASSFSALLNNALAFFGRFARNGTRRLKLTAGGKILVYQVICKDAITLTPNFSNEKKCVGTFTLKLVEPEPVKRVLSGGGTITIKSKTPVNIYWGDGSHNYDVSGGDIEQTVSGSGGETIITGEPNDFTSFSSSSSILWSRLV